MSVVYKVVIACFVGAIIFMALVLWTMYGLKQTVEPFVANCFALFLLILGGSVLLVAPKGDGKDGESS